MEKQKLIRGSEPTIQIAEGITATLMLDFDRYSNGSMVMRIADTDCEVSRGDDKVGSIGMAMGGTFYVQVADRMWKLDLMQIFALVEAAEKEQYLSVAELAGSL